MDELLRRALAPVLRDLESTGAPVPEIGEHDWAADPAMATAMLDAADGTSIGVRVMLAAAEADRVADVAEQVQEWAIEQLWGHAPTNWPACPNHPISHPMAAVSRDSVARWVCPADGTPFDEIGSLA